MTLYNYLLNSTEKVVLIIVCLSIFIPSFAQGYETSATAIASTHFQDGQAALLAKEYKLAIRHFKKALKVQEEFTVAHRLIGQCHTLLGQYPEAANEYLQILKTDSMFSRLIYFEVGDTYYKMGKHELALKYFETFKRLQDRPVDAFGLQGVNELADELILKDRLDNNIRACQISIDSVKFINVTEIFNLGKSINSSKDDYFPFLTNNQEELYFTRRGVENDEDLFLSKKNSNGQWKNASKIKDFNTKYPEGMSTFVRDGRRLFFTACLRDSVDGPCDIWEAILEEGSIQSITSLGIPVNSVYWESQATVSCDGSQLFFASNRPGGVGGTDIYMTQRLPSGLWSLPVNLGTPLNTPGDEEAPYISNDGKTLYFSSTGHLGLGEQDVFMSWWDNRMERWSTPINLGPPVNSPHRELGFYLSADGKTGFFASNRPGGQGKMDIYRFELSEKLFGDPITFMQGMVKDSVLLSPVSGTVTINGRPPVITDNDGRFFLCAGAEETLDIEFVAEEYKPYHNQFFIPEWDNRSFYPIELLLQPEFSFLAELEAEEAIEEKKEKQHIVTHSMLFGFDSAELNSTEIDRLMELISNIEGNKIIKVEIIGFADDIGKQSYNLQLSEDRAKHAAVFLLNRSIKVDDIHIEGKGTIFNDKERALNRRVDIKITLVE